MTRLILDDLEDDRPVDREKMRQWYEKCFPKKPPGDGWEPLVTEEGVWGWIRSVDDHDEDDSDPDNLS